MNAPKQRSKARNERKRQEREAKRQSEGREIVRQVNGNKGKKS